MYEAIERTVLDSGLWDNGRRESHSFPLTPEVFRLTSTQYQMLEQMGAAMKECQEGLSRILAIANQPDLCRGDTWNLLRQVSNLQVPKEYQALQIHKPKHVPHIVKVDLVEREDGQLVIAEIDAMNRRAMGYASLFAKIRDLVEPKGSVLPGIGSCVCREMKKRQSDRLIFLYGHRERFYLPEFKVFEAAMRTYGIEVVVVDECEMQMNGDELLVRGQPEASRWFINFPIMTENLPLIEALAVKYKSGEMQCLIPPKPFLGSKVVCALLRNDGANAALEAVLRSQIDHTALTVIRGYLPPTYMVTHDTEISMNGTAYVLKEVISSGAKGVFFGDDPGFPAAMVAAKKSRGRFILQEEVRTKQRSFGYYETTNRTLTTADLHTRIVVYFVAGRPAEAVVTASRSKCVHGGKGAINMGVVID